MAELLKIIKEFTGGMDTDSPNEVIGPKSYVASWNGRMNGPKGNERFESIQGNRILPNQSMTSGSGSEKTIGRFYDQVYKRTFFFNFSNSGNHGIYIFNTLTGIFQTLIRIGVTVGAQYNVLNFTADGAIDDIGIIYGDPQEGNLLCFLDSSGSPTQINIEKYLANTYGFSFTRAYLNVIKAPPSYPPRTVYENDTTVNNNNCTNSMFRFATAYIYDNNNKSVLSPASALSIPVNPPSSTISVNKSKDARIGVFFNTGPANVLKIRLFVKQTQNGATSDWLEVDTIDKASGGIANSTQYKYNFYNSGNYPAADITYANQLQDYVPDKAGAQAIINGDTLAYVNIVEGQDWFKSNFSAQFTPNPQASNINGFLLYAATDGTFSGTGATQPNIRITITGAGTNDAQGNPTTIDNPEALQAQVTVQAISSTDGDISFTLNLPGSPNIAAMLTAVTSAATAIGWLTVAALNSANSIVIYYPNGTVNLKSSYYVTPSTSSAITTARLAHYPQSNYSYGLVYYDANGKSNGVITDVTGNISTLPVDAYSGFVSAFTGIKLFLGGITPPAWAVRYAVVRTDTLTYSKWVQWVSNRALSNVGQLVDNQYAYIGITNIVDYNFLVPASQDVVKYDFSQGDRIRITALYPVTGAVVFGLNYDYQILGLEVNPAINGTIQQGNFIKIAYPTADTVAGGGQLNFNDDVNFSNYQITMYHIASSVAPQTENTGTNAAEGNVYYEMGLKFGIGNQGLPSAYHFGNAADNQVYIQDGDIFYRQRIVPVNSTYQLYASKMGFGNRYATAKVASSPNPTITVPGAFTISTQTNLAADAFNPANYPKFSDANGLFQNLSGNNYIVRLSGSFDVQCDSQSWVDLVCKVVGPTGTTIQNPFVLQHSPGIGAAGTITISFDGKFTVPPGWKLWFLLGNGESAVNMNFNGFMLRMDITRNISIMVFDASYSDTYNLVVNSDNRPQVADPEQKRLTYGTRIRWSLADQLDSSLNESNRFYYENSDEYVKSFGDVARLTVIGKSLHIFHERKCGTVGIYQKWIKNNSGEDQLIVNNQIIEKNNIRYEIYEGGVGNQPGSIVISNYAHYFVDPVKGYICRWSNDGVVIISLLYRTQTWAGTNLPKYLTPHTYQFGGNARVLGAFMSVTDNNALYILMAQGGTSVTGDIISARSIIFDESDNAFEGFWHLSCDAIISTENTLYSFNQGKMWVHDNYNQYANFFGVQYPVSMDMVWNENPVIKKKFNSISYQSNRVWTANNIGDISTSFINPQTGLQQQSQLLDVDQEIQENVRYGAFLRDANSNADPAEGLNEGDYLEGSWIETHLEYDGGQFAYLFAPYILYEDSPRNF